MNRGAPRHEYESSAYRYGLGNEALPIYTQREQIAQSLQSYPVSIIEGQTGSGKSTQTPQFALDIGFEAVIATQPRIAAAKSLSERVSEEIRQSSGDALASCVGYRVAEHGNTTAETRLTFATDGLATQWILHGGLLRRKNSLILFDEVHEANKNIIVGMAAVRLALEEGMDDIRVGIMSATMDTVPLAQYFSPLGNTVPIHRVEGRMYPVEERQGGMVVDEAVAYAKEGLNPIVFVPGVPEVEVTAAAIRARLPREMRVLEAHGQQTHAEQARLFEHYPAGKVIVGTNVLQTSLTIDDMDVVVDSEWSRIGHARNDVQTLDVVPSSLATSEQRKGRVGRTKPGIYVRAQLEGYPEVPTNHERADYDASEIQTSRIDDMYAKLRQAYIDPRRLTYFHQPTEGQFTAAETRLKRIHALDEKLEITEIGQEMSYLSLDPSWARMVVAARQYSHAIGLQAAALAAVRQSGGILRSEEGVVPRWQKLTKETHAEPLAELDVFIAALGMASAAEIAAHDIVERRLYKARVKFEDICEAEGLQLHHVRKPSAPERQDLIACMAVAADEFFKRTRSGNYVDTRGRRRSLRDDSIVQRSARLLLGQAFDLTVVTRGTFKTKKFMNGATDVSDLKVLQQLIPDRLHYKPVGFTFDAHTGVPIAKTQLYLDDGLWFPRYGREPARPSAELDEFLLRALLTKERLPKGEYPMRRQVRPIVRALQRLQDKTVEDLATDAVLDQLVMGIAQTLPEHLSSLEQADKYLPQLSLHHLIDQGIIEVVEHFSPDEVYHGDKIIPVNYQAGVATICVPIEAWSELPTTLPGLEDKKVMIKESPKAAPVLYEKARKLAQSGSGRGERRASEQVTPIDLQTYRIGKMPRSKLRRIRNGIQPRRYGN